MTQAKTLRRAGLLTAALTLLTLSSPATAQIVAEGGGTGVVSDGPTQDWRLNAYGVLRGGGEWRIRTDGPDGSADMAVGGGLGLRLEIPLHKYVVIGPLLDYHLLNPASYTVLGTEFDFENIHALTFGVWSKGRYVLDLAGNPFEVYIGIPMGLAVYMSDDGDGGTFPEVGVSIGLMFGAQLFISDRFGFLLETGFRRDGFRDRNDDGRDDDVRSRTLQFVMNAGISIAL